MSNALTGNGTSKAGLSNGVAWLAGGFVIVTAVIALQAGFLSLFDKKR